MSSNERVKLNQFIGQKAAIDSLKISIEAAKIKNEILSHVLLIGERGSGKQTLAYAIADDLKANIHSISMRAIKKDSDLAAILTNLCPGDVLLAENFGAIKPDCVDLLCTAMDSFSMDIIIGKGPGARNVKLELPAFTLIATMDENNELPQKIINCFPLKFDLVEYSHTELGVLSKIFASQLEVSITEEASMIIAETADGSYRKMINLLKRARDFAIVKNNGNIDEDTAKKTISLIG